MTERKIIHTIGHSNHLADRFSALLHRHEITAVVDIRSTPYSRYNPQFNKEDLKELLESKGIFYVFMGRELGGRPDEPSFYENGMINYQLMVQSPLFRKGLEHLLKLCETYRMALLCAEKDPLRCHRTLLVGRQLQAMGCEVRNILADGSLLCTSSISE